jgi:hypothetical protein
VEIERKIGCTALEEHQSTKRIPQICWKNQKTPKRGGFSGGEGKKP